jgi:hypothetical protein
MLERPENTILDWILDEIIIARGGDLRTLPADELEELIKTTSGLNDAQRAVLLSRDPLRIRAVIEYELGYRSDEFMMHTGPIYFVIPMHF